MTTLLVSLPYAKFDSDWFSLVPNVNLATAEGCLEGAGHPARSFHFHLEFLPFLEEEPPAIRRGMERLASRGVEFFSLDYLAATLLFAAAPCPGDPLAARLEQVGLPIGELPLVQGALARFLDHCFQRLEPHLAEARTVAFSSSHGQLAATLLLARRVRERQPGAAIVIGGKDVAGASGWQVLNRFPWVDHVAFGECEATLLAFAAGMRDEAGLSPGMLSRGRKGRVKRGRAIPGIDLDEAPLPRYRLEDFPVSPERLILPLELGRGCSWGKCSFCPDRVYGIAARTKSAPRVAAEIEAALRLDPALVRHLVLDADALKDPALIHDLAPLVENRGLTIVFAELRAERLTRETLADFMRLGRWGAPFQVGIESFGRRMLERMNKGVDPLVNAAAVKAAAELGAPLQFNLITSFPRMTRADLEENLEVLESIRHLLVRPTIHLYPSEFYLPPDCDIHERAGHYRIRHTRESTFSAAFPDSKLHALGNYPHYLAFENHDEQMRFSTTLRAWLAKLEELRPGDCRLTWRDDGARLTVDRREDGADRAVVLENPRRLLVLAALEKVRTVEEGAAAAGVDFDEAGRHLTWLAGERIVLLDVKKNRYLALPTPATGDDPGRLATVPSSL